MAAEHLQSCFYVANFEEFMEVLPIPEDLICQYCIDVRLFDYIHFKSHMLKVHFHHAYILEHDGKSARVLPCRSNCYPRASLESNRSHFHCPFCRGMYGRKESMHRHLSKLKDGKCPITYTRTNARKRLLKLHHARTDDDPSKDLVDLYATHVNGMSEESGYDKSSSEETPYTVVVEKGNDGLYSTTDITELTEEESSSKKMRFSDIPRSLQTLQKNLNRVDRGIKQNSQSSHRSLSITSAKSPPDLEDAAAHFGKTVTLRLRDLDARKQAEAMQKIMQVLFEVEYSASSHMEIK